MSSSSKRSIHIGWRSALTVTVGCVVWWSAVPSATSQQSESPVFVASLSVSTMQPEFILNSVRDRPARQVIAHPDRPIPALHREPTDSDAWEAFEAEYRPDPRSPSSVKRPIETAKYGLDMTVFAADRFVKSIRDHANFEFGQGNLRRTGASSRGGFLDNPSVKLDLDMTHGKPYLGARVVIPFGN